MTLGKTNGAGTCLWHMSKMLGAIYKFKLDRGEMSLKFFP